MARNVYMKARRRNGAVGKTYPIDHIPAPMWGELVAKPAPITRHPNRTPQHLLDLPTPEALAEFVESETGQGGNRQQRRARRARAERVAGRRGTLAHGAKPKARLYTHVTHWVNGERYLIDLEARTATAVERRAA